MNEEYNVNKSYNLTFVRKKFFKMLRNCLESTINFANSQMLSSVILDFRDKKPNYLRQKILREQGFFKILIDLIDSSFPNNEKLSKV